MRQVLQHLRTGKMEVAELPCPQTESWTVRIPEGVREVIGRRLNRLSERCNDTLTMASIVGREFEFSQLKALVEGLSEDMLLDVLEEALAARVIEEMPVYKRPPRKPLTTSYTGMPSQQVLSTICPLTTSDGGETLLQGETSKPVATHRRLLNRIWWDSMRRASYIL